MNIRSVIIAILMTAMVIFGLSLGSPAVVGAAKCNPNRANPCVTPTPTVTTVTPTTTTTPTVTPTPTATVTPTPTPTVTTPASKSLIKLGQDIPTSAQFAANKALYESRPFDGWAIHTNLKVFAPTAVSQATYAADIAQFPTGLTNSTHNFLRVLFVDPLDFTSDAQWTTIAANVGNLAAALRDSGRQFDGIVIDNEYYGSGGLWDNLSPTLARQRGTQVGAAFAAAWPAGKTMILYGPWVSEPATAAAFGPFYNDVAAYNEGMGPFAYGLAAGEFGTATGFIDGGEVYGARTAQDFANIKAWQKTGLANSGSSVIGDPTAYKAKVTASVGVYDLDMLNGYTLQPPATLTNLLQLAVNSVDTYAWLYTEKHEWGASQSGKPVVPQTYLDAVAAVG